MIQLDSNNIEGHTLSEYINKHKILNIRINRINKQGQIYGVPYRKKVPQTTQKPYEIGQSVIGKIFKSLPYGIRIKTTDGRMILIHISRLKELGYEVTYFEKGQSITLVKTGFDEEHRKDIWNINSIENV